MSRFADIAKTSIALSAASVEEASRQGLREADLDHLFLAVVINEQAAGQVLRGLGITIDDAREAVAELHSAGLASIGISAEVPESGRITSHEGGDYDLTERSRKIFERSAGKGKRGDAAAVLRELVTEPSGLIEDLLHRLGTSPAEVLARLEEAERIPDRAPRPPKAKGALSGFTRAFAPAPPGEVWALLADPARMPEWENGYESVEIPSDAEPIGPGSVWEARFITRMPNGKEAKIKPGRESQRVELLVCEPGERIAWRFSVPSEPRFNPRRVEIALEPAAGGTQLDISLAWELNPERRRRRILGWFMRPLYRFATWTQVTAVSSGISRALR